jgi:hypothetical protein
VGVPGLGPAGHDIWLCWTRSILQQEGISIDRVIKDLPQESSGDFF